MVNLFGEIVGIVNGTTHHGLGMAIPGNRCELFVRLAVNAATPVGSTETTSEKRRPVGSPKKRRKFVGIEMSNLPLPWDPQSRMHYRDLTHLDNGVLIHSVFENSPAKK